MKLPDSVAEPTPVNRRKKQVSRIMMTEFSQAHSPEADPVEERPLVPGMSSYNDVDDHIELGAGTATEPNGGVFFSTAAKSTGTEFFELSP